MSMLRQGGHVSKVGNIMSKSAGVADTGEVADRTDASGVKYTLE